MIVVFLLIVTIILVGGHAGLFYSWVWLFGIKSLLIKKIIAIALGILAISFVFSTVLVHFSENFVTENLYIGSSVWLGAAWYILIATVMALCISWIGLSLGIEFNRVVLTSIFLGIAVTYTCFGVWNALQIKVKNITVAIENLPDNWEGKKAVHVSDVHLGIYHYREFSERVVKIINEQKPDIAFITGDLFDGAGKKLNHMADPLDNISAPLGTYYVIGNHELFIGLEKCLEAVDCTRTTILRNEIAEADGVQIVGFDHPMPGKKPDFDSTLQNLDKSKPSIALYHEPKVDLVKKVRDAGVSLMLTGHTHKGQMWPFGLITKAMYNGIDYGQFKKNGFTIYTSSGVGTWGPPMRTGNQSEIVVITFKKS